MCVFIPPPPYTAAFGPMSLMQFWTKLYSQLGRPLPKVLVLFASFFVSFFKTSCCVFEGVFVFDVLGSDC